MKGQEDKSLMLFSSSDIWWANFLSKIESVSNEKIKTKSVVPAITHLKTIELSLLPT